MIFKKFNDTNRNVITVLGCLNSYGFRGNILCYDHYLYELSDYVSYDKIHLFKKLYLYDFFLVAGLYESVTFESCKDSDAVMISYTMRDEEFYEIG